MDNNSKVDGVEALSPFLRTLMKGDPHDLDETVVNNTKKRCLEELKRTNNIESGKAAYWFANGQDYGYKHGIKLGHPTGRRACRKTLDQSKRGRIVMFSRESRRHFIAAMETHDLPNGSIKYYITLTALHWGENKWKRKDVLDDFDKVRKTFRTSFARCFKRCAIIYRLEMGKGGAPHMHVIFYAPLGHNWITDAYSYTTKMRKSKKQVIIDSGGMIPTNPDGCHVDDFVHNVFKVLWFNAMCRRPIPQDKLPDFWVTGVHAKVIDEKAAPDFFPKLITYLAKKTQCYPRGKQWGYMQPKNFVVIKPEAIDIPPEIRHAVLQKVWALSHNGKPFPEKFEITGFYSGITHQTLKNIIKQVKQEMCHHKHQEIPSLSSPKPSMTPDNTSALKEYLAFSLNEHMG